MQVLPVRRVNKKIFLPPKRREEEKFIDPTPMADNDEMENHWGVNLVDLGGKASGTKEDLNRLIKSSVLGFKLLKLVGCGTDAIQLAIDKATDRDISRLLIACGSYVGGDNILSCYSSTKMLDSKLLSLPMYPDDVQEQGCLNQTVALPYHIPGSEKYCEDKIRQVEKNA